MLRGPKPAWTPVALAFVLEAALIGAIARALLDPLAQGRVPTLAEPGVTLVAGVLGLLLAAWVFWDRWRVLEARASHVLDERTRGFVRREARTYQDRLAIAVGLWLGAAARVLGYANLRGLRKLVGR